MSAEDRPLEGSPMPYDRLHPRLYVAEAAGTALLVAVGLSVVIVCFGVGGAITRSLPNTAARHVLAGALFGTTGALITLSPLGRLSGAHINPAVTLAFWLESKIAWRDALAYVAAQCLGGILGAVPLLAWGRLGASIDYGATLVGAGFPVWQALLGEVVATALLVLAIFITAAHAPTRRFTPWTLPPLFAWLVWWESPISGASTNPARSLGPALIAGQWHGFWIYVVGPAVGAALAIGLLRLEVIGRHAVTVARVFHIR
jgi:aquaporin Z